MYEVAIVKYQEGLDSLKHATNLVGGFQGFSAASKVVIKPNFVLWHEGGKFPKYGVLTTARLIEELVVLLKEYGIHHISLVEAWQNVLSGRLFPARSLICLPKGTASIW